MARSRDEHLERYALAIQLRADGLSYRQMAPRLGVKTADGAQQVYWAARASQIPAVAAPTVRTRPPLVVIAWAAGFFDGEGCVFGYEDVQGGYRRFTFGVAVAQTTPEPLERLAMHWGGNVRSRPAPSERQKPQWRWEIRGAKAAAFLEDVLPYLVVKHEAALAGMPVMFRTHRHGIAFSTDEVAERRAAVARLRELNRRGPAE